MGLHAEAAVHHVLNYLPDRASCGTACLRSSMSIFAPTRRCFAGHILMDGLDEVHFEAIAKQLRAQGVIATETI